MAPAPDVEPDPAPDPDLDSEPEPDRAPVRTADNDVAGGSAGPGDSGGGTDYSGRRPVGLTMGIGFGYDLPADLTIPNITSIRFRLDGGLTFEPFVQLSNLTSKVDIDGADTSDSDTTIEAGTNVRIPMAERGPIDFILQAGAAMSFNIDDPEGADNSTNTTILSATWGVGLNWWLYRNVCVSLTGTNPFLLINRVSIDATNTKNTDVLLGAIFEPNVILMGHLFY